MTLDKHLEEFYKENNIPIDGGFNDTSFNFKVFGIKLKLPNPKFRRDAIHIHDLQHVLNHCDTSWKGGKLYQVGKFQQECGNISL